MIFAVDFDGTLCTNNYPKIGEPRVDVVNKCKWLKSQGHTLILWTCRHDSLLEEAVEWCKSQGLIFDTINTSTQDYLEKYGGTSGKVGANYYIDDKNLSIDDFVKGVF